MNQVMSLKSAALGALLLALICCVYLAEAQKTAANSFQQQFGGGPNSAYGGYQSSASQQRQTGSNFGVAPVNQQRRTQQSSYSSRQQAVQRPVQPQVYQQQQISSSSSSGNSYEQAEADSEPASYGSVSGQPGVDFPNYTRVPKTSFSCDGLPYDYGMYADEETGCQAYHVCYNGRKDSFLCGPGTVFNQRILHCDYWYSVECGKSSQYYSSNAYMGSSQPEPGPAQASNSNSNSYQRTESSSNYNRPSPANSQRVQSASFNRNTIQQTQENY